MTIVRIPPLRLFLYLVQVTHVIGFVSPIYRPWTWTYHQQRRAPWTLQSSVEPLSFVPQVVAIVGSGAVGSYYGARLWQAGHDVHFYLRGANYDAAVANGLNVTSVEGDVWIPPHSLQAYNCTTQMASSITQESGIDWVIVALKSTALDAIPALVLPLLQASSSQARVLVIMNGMIEEDLLRSMRIHSGQTTSTEEASFAVPPPLQCCRAWYGGMALICCNRLAPAVVDHTYFGLLSAGVASTLSTSNDHDRDAFVTLFAPTMIDVAYEESLVRGRWKKMLWNLPFNGLSVAMGGITVDQIVSDPGLRQLACAIMDETIATANTELAHLATSDDFVRLGTVERATMMKLSDDMGPYKPSTMLDFVYRRGMEVQYLFRTPVDRARRLGVPVPHLETIVAQIEAYQRLYNLY